MIEYCIRGDDVESESESGVTVLSSTRGRLEEVLLPRESPNLFNSERNVVIVMDALKDFSPAPLQWALNNVTRSGCAITFLGIMPYLPLACPYNLVVIRASLDSCKSTPQFWTNYAGERLQLKEKCEWMNEQNYQTVRRIIELCDENEVVPYMKTAVGNPLKLVALEQTTSLHATLVVLDRSLKKYGAFFGKRIPSSVVVMNNNGGVDLVKVQSATDQSDTIPGETPMTAAPPTPQVILSQELSQLLGSRLASVYNRMR